MVSSKKKFLFQLQYMEIFVKDQYSTFYKSHIDIDITSGP